jgi:hypothetical protein
MSYANAAFLDLVLLWMALGASLLAGVFLSLEFWAGRRLARRAPGVVAAVLAAIGATFWVAGGTVIVSVACELVAALCALAWAASFETMQRQACRLLAPKVVWCLLLGVGVVASRVQGVHLLASVRKIPAAEVDFRDVPLRDLTALTDAGSAIPLFQFEMFTPPEHAEEVVLAAEKYRHHVIRLGESDAACNCHGWIFTGGKFGIRNSEIPAILRDNGYVRVEQASPGDLAIYEEGAEITHSGLVRIADPNAPILVESKWGPFGVFLHPPEAQPFTGHCQFYRSQRRGHVLVLRQTVDSRKNAASGQAKSQRL